MLTVCNADCISPQCLHGPSYCIFISFVIDTSNKDQTSHTTEKQSPESLKPNIRNATPKKKVLKISILKKPPDCQNVPTPPSINPTIHQFTNRNNNPTASDSYFHGDNPGNSSPILDLIGSPEPTSGQIQKVLQNFSYSQDTSNSQDLTPSQDSSIMMKFLPKPPDSPSPSAVQSLCPGSLQPKPPDSPGPSAVQAWCPGLLQIIPVQLTKGPDGRILVSHAMKQAKTRGSVTSDSVDGKDSQDQLGQGQDQGQIDPAENSKENSIAGESIISLEDSSASICMSSMNSSSSGSKVLTLRRRTTPTKLRLMAKDLPVSESTHFCECLFVWFPVEITYV